MRVVVVVVFAFVFVFLPIYIPKRPSGLWSLVSLPF